MTRSYRINTRLYRSYRPKLDLGLAILPRLSFTAHLVNHRSSRLSLHPGLSLLDLLNLDPEHLSVDLATVARKRHLGGTCLEPTCTAAG